MKFPSPYGDFVFQQQEGAQRGHQERRFRPLTGILFFNWTHFLSLRTSLSLVSVPLRGFCFSTRLRGYPFRSSCQFVSVPLRGFCFSTSPSKSFSA